MPLDPSHLDAPHLDAPHLDHSREVRTRTVITVDDCRHDADDIDPTAPGYGAHLPFHSILQRCGLAWRAYLATLPGVDDGVIVPNLSADFLAEVHVGPLEIAVSLVRVGSSSFTVRCDVEQDGATAARVTVVLVKFDYERRRSVPLTPAQREVLEAALPTDERG